MSDQNKPQENHNQKHLHKGENSTSENHGLVAMQQFQGPLPPPHILKAYEEICPGTAERVLNQFERETEHRHDVERKIVDAQLDVQRAEIPTLRNGQIFAFLIAVFGLGVAGASVILASNSSSAWAGASIAGVSLATLVGVFVYGRKSKMKNEESEEDID